MSLFKNRNNLDQQIQKVESETISSIVDQNMTINGEMTFKGKTRIDGTINGDLNGEHLILSQSGTIIGDINVTTFICHGNIEGNIFAGVVTARKGCSIRGKLEAENLIVEPGASLDGEVKTSREQHPGNNKEESASSTA